MNATRPSYQQIRIEQMAYALGVHPLLLGLPAPTSLELAQDRFLQRLEQLACLWRVPSGRIDRKIRDRKVRT